MAKKDEPQGIQCENVDIELLRRQLARLETIITDKFSEVRELIENAPAQMPVFPPPAEPTQPLGENGACWDKRHSRGRFAPKNGVCWDTVWFAKPRVSRYKP